MPREPLPRPRPSKWAHDKGVKPRSYAPNDKIWLNSKYIKTKCNRKLEIKFFRLFQVLHHVGKQAYKLELPRKWRIHNVFYVSLLEQDITKKKQVDKEVRQMEFDLGNNDSGEYKVEAIWDSTVYAKELESGHLLGLYYLVSWKRIFRRREYLGASLSSSATQETHQLIL